MHFLRKIKNYLLPPTEKQLALQNSDNSISWLRNNGVSVGQGTRFFTPASRNIDLTRPELIIIGDNIIVARGCTILIHGYEWCVFLDLYLGGFSVLLLQRQYLREGVDHQFQSFKEFFFLFSTASMAEQQGIDVKRQTTVRHYERFKADHQPIFSSFQELIAYRELWK